MVRNTTRGYVRIEPPRIQTLGGFCSGRTTFIATNGKLAIHILYRAQSPFGARIDCLRVAKSFDNGWCRLRSGSLQVWYQHLRTHPLDVGCIIKKEFVRPRSRHVVLTGCELKPATW